MIEVLQTILYDIICIATSSLLLWQIKKIYPLVNEIIILTSTMAPNNFFLNLICSLYLLHNKLIIYFPIEIYFIFFSHWIFFFLIEIYFIFINWNLFIFINWNVFYFPPAFSHGNLFYFFHWNLFYFIILGYYWVT